MKLTNRNKYIIIALSILLIFLIVTLLFSISRSKEKEWIRDNLEIKIDYIYETPRLTNTKLPDHLSSDSDISLSHMQLVTSINQYNDEVSLLKQEVIQLKSDLLSTGRADQYKWLTIILLRSQIELDEIKIRETQQKYIDSLTLYWDKHFISIPPKGKLVKCDFRYTVEEIVPNTNSFNAYELEKLNERTCLPYSQNEGDSVAGQIISTSQLPTTTPLPTSSPMPTVTATVVPPYQNGPKLSTSAGFYVTNEYIYTYSKESLDNYIRKYKITTGELLEEYRSYMEAIKWISNDGNYALGGSPLELSYLPSSSIIQQGKTDFLAITSNEKSILGYKCGMVANGGSECSVDLYDLLTMSHTRNILNLPGKSADSKPIYNHIIEAAFINGNELLLIYSSRQENEAKSTLILWDTSNWSITQQFDRTDGYTYSHLKVDSTGNRVLVSLDSPSDGTSSIVEFFTLDDLHKGIVTSQISAKGSIAALGYHPTGKIIVVTNSKEDELEKSIIKLFDLGSSTIFWEQQISPLSFITINDNGVVVGIQQTYGKSQPVITYLPNL